ncbi:MAG: 4-(cytidine 5'-diphospho)-2-C-methyl-D-erythritol kinase [Kiritimatiellae bacterium]|nr:4-(cytidine 5'-diphospho)-2-C-methyl-D-erythritol kinase [Kiritimatiellia bacterium]
MTLDAPAKVNFTLEVLGKRVDGYHALRSVVMPISLSDTVTMEPAGDISSDSPYPDDLCVKAARTLLACVPGGRDAPRRGVRISVVKRIPAGGGLGGGSADAAAVLRGLNSMWGLGLPPGALADIGAKVGSDVPALVLAQHHRAPVLMEGRGERVRLLLPGGGPAPGLCLVLANPGVFSSTPEVFSRSTPHLPEDPSILYNMSSALAGGDIGKVASALQNDLEAPAISLHPEIAGAKKALAEAGAAGVLMSGSGSTVFGLVPSEARGREIAALLEAKGLRAWSAVACPVV